MTVNSLQKDRKQLVFVILAFAAIYTIWGTTYLGIRVALETMPPFFMAAARFLLAGALIFTLLRLRGVPMPRRFHWRSAVIIGALLVVGGNGLVTWSEQQVASGTAALVVATEPLWIALLDWAAFKGPRPGKRAAIGVVLGLVGIILLIGPGQILGTADFNLSSLLILLLAPIFWATGSLYSRQAELPENTFMSTAMEMMAGGVLLLLVGFMTGEANRFHVAAFSARSLAAMVYLTIFGSIVAFSAYVWLLKRVPATKVATYSYVNPVFAVFLGWLILNETITGTTIAAVIIIIAGVILITTWKPGEEPAWKQGSNKARVLAHSARMMGTAAGSDNAAT